jgi:S-adenosylmethionine:tRNA ribosyltransferase-isomerase
LFSLNDYDYTLPEDRIAQKPADRRDHSRLLVIDRNTGDVSHHVFSDLTDFLTPKDILVINNTRVIPGRLYGRKKTGGKVEALILNYASDSTAGTVVCHCMLKCAKGPKPGTGILFSNDKLEAVVLESNEAIHTVRFKYPGDFGTLLDQIGKMPLPPYIRRDEGKDPPCDDRAAYQTVYASQKGAVAAPTAGLHFTPEMLEKIKAGGTRIAAITLHVGYGTFVPVRVSDVRDHQMHSEGYAISAETSALINQTRSSGGRVIAVGTTSVRTLEYAANDRGQISASAGQCDLFIYPGYRFKMVDAIITNFHLPKSTLIMLISAFAGRERILNAYQAAIENGYRFYSYGDAMLII